MLSPVTDTSRRLTGESVIGFGASSTVPPFVKGHEGRLLGQPSVFSYPVLSSLPHSALFLLVSTGFKGVKIVFKKVLSRTRKRGLNCTILVTGFILI